MSLLLAQSSLRNGPQPRNGHSDLSLGAALDKHSRFVALLSQPERFLDAPQNPQSLLAVLSGEASPDPPSSGVTLLPELLITRQRRGVHSGAKTSVRP